MTTELSRELGSTFLFEELGEEQLAWLVERAEVCTFDTDAQVYVEGEPGAFFYVLLAGGVRLTRRVGSDVIELPETTQRGVYAGATQAIVVERGNETYTNSLWTTRPSRLARFRTEDFSTLLQRWYPMAVHLLEGLFVGVRNSEAMVRQHEQLSALGALSAGLAHELNNPAAAATRATGQLRERVSAMRHKLAMIADGRLSADDLGELVAAQERIVDLAAKAPRRSPLAVTEAEDELTEWLDDRGVASGWQIAGVFAEAGVETPWLAELAHQIDEGLLDPALRWLMYTLETEALMAEIEEATGRISTLVTAVKQYSHMDRAPVTDVDVTDGLESTLTLMRHQLGAVEVHREYPEPVPTVPGHAGELNQVWTNLVDNAVRAMDGSGALTLTVGPRDGGVEVVVADTGPGIPDDVLPHVFEAFYTTRAAGEGSGLGLEIVHRIVTQRHRGTIEIDAGRDGTRVHVWLPGESGRGRSGEDSAVT